MSLVDTDNVTDFTGNDNIEKLSIILTLPSILQHGNFYSYKHGYMGVFRLLGEITFVGVWFSIGQRLLLLCNFPPFMKGSQSVPFT